MGWLTDLVADTEIIGTVDSRLTHDSLSSSTRDALHLIHYIIMFRFQFRFHRIEYSFCRFSKEVRHFFCSRLVLAFRRQNFVLHDFRCVESA